MCDCKRNCCRFNFHSENDFFYIFIFFALNTKIIQNSAESGKQNCIKENGLGNYYVPRFLLLTPPCAGYSVKLTKRKYLLLKILLEYNLRKFYFKYNFNKYSNNYDLKCVCTNSSTYAECPNTRFPLFTIQCEALKILR